MDTKHLEIFVEVLRNESLAATARRRGMDPSAVSRIISGLEDELGVRLLQRTTRRIAPTEAGVRFFAQLEPLLEELDKARALTVETSSIASGELRIAAPVSFGQRNLVPLLPEFARQFPKLVLDLVLTDNPIDLITERIDVAIRLGPLSETGLVAVQLAPMIGRVCASPAYVEAHGRPRTPEDLKNHDCLLLDMPGFGPAWRVCRPGQSATPVCVRGVLKSSNAIALVTCALAGMGITLQATWLVGRELGNGRLLDLFPDYEATAATFPNPAMWILYPSRRYVPEKVRKFVDFVKSAFATKAPWDAKSR